jgi:hypothetical protein
LTSDSGVILFGISNSSFLGAGHFLWGLITIQSAPIHPGF